MNRFLSLTFLSALILNSSVWALDGTELQVVAESAIERPAAPVAGSEPAETLSPESSDGAIEAALTVTEEGEESTSIPEFSIERTFIIGDEQKKTQLTNDFWTPQKTHNWKVGNLSFEIAKENMPKNPEIFGTVEEQYQYKIKPEKVREYLSQFISELDPGERVSLKQNEDGSVEVEGVPNTGQAIDYTKAVEIIQASIESGDEVLDVQMKEVFTPLVVSEELQAQGITEIISIGSSNFAGSSSARRVNIQVGMGKFLGQTIKKGEIFSFNDIIVSTGFNEASGYVPELVIKGDKTLKELGGGLCQVSTTTYRAAFNAGLPIDARRSHSYAVPYYEPVGFDATIYLGGQDLKFTNDTPGDILIHPYMEGNELHFIFYGTKDRDVTSEGPFVYNRKSIPAPKYEVSRTVAPGGRVKKSGGYEGFNAHWNRTVQKYGEEPMETEVYKSSYRAEPVTYLVGPAIQRAAAPAE